MYFLDYTFYHNTVRTWLIASGIGLLALLVLTVLVSLLGARLQKLADRTTNRWDNLVAHIVSHTRKLFLLFVALHAGSLALELPGRIRAIIASVTVLVLLVQGGIWVTAALAFALDDYRERTYAEDRAAVTTVSALGFVAKVLVWSIALLLALDNFGIDVTTLIAGLGIGGIALALATQSILGDLFASLAIVLDKPFVLGDFLSVGDFLGSVEYIGLKTTRLRSLSGEQLVFSNSDLLDSRIRNYGRMAERRVLFQVGVVYQTPRERLEAIPDIMRQAVEAHDNTRFDRAHLASYGDFSIVFEIVYYVLSPDYNTYMDVQQDINLFIHRAFEEQEIEFAYPTQTLYLSRASG